jgi:hypothetical protein
VARALAARRDGLLIRIQRYPKFPFCASELSYDCAKYVDWPMLLKNATFGRGGIAVSGQRERLGKSREFLLFLATPFFANSGCHARHFWFC